MPALRARGRRDGQRVEVAAGTLVPGDIVLLEAGDKVPAAARRWRIASAFSVPAAGGRGSAATLISSNALLQRAGSLGS